MLVSLSVRRIRSGEGRRLRELRLRALADAPLAFGSTLAREEAFAEGVWQDRAALGATGESQVTFVAEDGECWVGMVTGLVADPEGPRPELVGMFVEPASRGRGIGAALVEAVAAWARERRMARLYLWVTSTNQAALALYRRCDFRPTGRSQPLDHTPSLSELEMARDV